MYIMNTPALRKGDRRGEAASPSGRGHQKSTCHGEGRRRMKGAGKSSRREPEWSRPWAPRWPGRSRHRRARRPPALRRAAGTNPAEPLSLLGWERALPSWGLCWTGSERSSSGLTRILCAPWECFSAVRLRMSGRVLAIKSPLKGGWAFLLCSSSDSPFPFNFFRLVMKSRFHGHLTFLGLFFTKLAQTKILFLFLMHSCYKYCFQPCAVSCY